MNEEQERENKAQEILNTIHTEKEEKTIEIRLKKIEELLNTIRLQNIGLLKEIKGNR